MTETLTLNGVPLDSHAFAVSDISGLLRTPAQRGENVVVPNRHGRIRTVGKRFDANEVVLPITLVGAEADGSVPVDSTRRRELFKRRDELLRLLYADPLILQYTCPDGHVVQAEAEVVDVLDFTSRGVEPFAQVSVALSILGAFWEDANSVSQDVTGTTGVQVPLAAFDGATAPISDLLITAVGPVNNPMWQHGERWVRYLGAIPAGSQLQIDTGAWAVSPGSGALWTPDVGLIEQGRPGPWFELDPAVTPFSVTFTHTTGGSASSAIAGRRQYLAP